MGVFDIFKRRHRSHDHRETMFEYSNKAYDLHPETPDLDLTILFKNVTVRIVGTHKKFTWKKARIKANGVAAFASHSRTADRIEILGKVVNGQIVLNQARLGHEWQHLLKWAGPGETIANPDKLDKLF